MPLLTIRVDSDWFPPEGFSFEVDPASNKPPSALMRALKPRFTVSAGGFSFPSVAPAGEPRPGRFWPVVKVGLAALAVFLPGALALGLWLHFRRKS